MPKLLFLVAEDWYFVSHRLPLAVAARQHGFEVAVVTRLSCHLPTFQAAGLSVIPFETHRQGVNPLGVLREAFALAAIYRRERPDLVHHVALRPVVVGALAARLSGVRSVVSAVAGLGFLFAVGGRSSNASRFLKKVLSWLLARGLVIVQNPDDRAFLERAGVRNTQIRLIPGAGVDVESFRPGKPPAGQPVVMLASRLLWDKGVGEFVEAARNLGGRARFVLVGAPDTANPATVPQSQIEAWAKEGLIEWWGARSDMPDVLREAAIFCLPSFYREGMPKALLEAMATGLPCITTDAPGCRDALQDEVSGLLVPVRDTQALTQALDRLLSDAELRARLGEAARQRVLEQFSSERIIEATLAVYTELMSPKPGQA